MSALVLKLIACVTMLIDHIGYCTPGATWMRIIGRVAFPIYVYLMTEGLRHSSNRLRYALRLLLFAVLSQVPFGLLVAKDPGFPEGSVMVTLLLAYLSVWLVDVCRGRKVLRVLCWLPVLGLCYVMHRDWIPCDYGARGVLLAQAFYWLSPLARGKKRAAGALLLFAGAFCATFYGTLLTVGESLLRQLSGVSRNPIQIPGWTLLQAFSLMSLPLILLYNGRKGWCPASKAGRKALQYAFYAFYPVHMLILYFTIR